jgi:hypothetical protein
MALSSNRRSNSAEVMPICFDFDRSQRRCRNVR